MSRDHWGSLHKLGRFIPVVLTLTAHVVQGQPYLGPEELLLADGVDIDVPGYSVPSFVHWDDDGLKDLVVGEGSGTYTPKVRVYLNVGTGSEPQYSTYFYAQSGGGDLTVPGSGCLGLFPRTVYWDGDARKDLLVGLADGTIKLFLNVATDDGPGFNGGTFLQVGEPGLKTNIDVGYRATPTVVDWNNDQRKDLVVGALDGMIRIFLNEGTDTYPDFRSEARAQDSGVDLVVPSGRSSPVIVDLDHDGRKDLLAGNTNGQLLFYGNAGLDAAPSFSGYLLVEADGVPIDLPGSPRSRPFVADCTGDGVWDVLIGAGDGKVHFYQGLCTSGDFDDDGEVGDSDFVHFEECLNGPDAPPAQPGCDETDLDSDGHVDLGDFASFQSCLPSSP